jgi:branched-chain amino acid transport system substrate-binding protein
VRTLALISPNDQSGRDTSAAIKDAIKNLGLNIQVVAEEEYQRGTQEFTSLLTRVLQKNPDMIDLSGSPTADGALILKQLRELGYRGQRAWLSMLDPVPVVRTAGAEAAEGLLGIQGWDLKSEMAPASLRDFAQRFEQRFGEPATLIAAANYASYQIVTQAMALCRCTDSTKVAQTIVQTGSFDTILGKVLIGGERTYGAKHQFLYPNLVYEMRGGVSVPLARVEPQP